MYTYRDTVISLIAQMQDTYELTEKTIRFYSSRLLDFFDSHMDTDENRAKPLDTITYFDVNAFLRDKQCSDAQKLNYYQSFKRFFEYTNLRRTTDVIIGQIVKPIYKKKAPQYLTEEEYLKLRTFIVDKTKPIVDRLILGLFLFTGLSRKYIASLKNSQIHYEDGTYRLTIWKENVEYVLPLKAEMQVIITEYLMNMTLDPFAKISEYDENYLSTFVSNQTKSITGKKRTPTILSNTFIRKALTQGNYIWEVSELTLESVNAIEKHLVDTENLYKKQMAILNGF